MQVSRPAVTAAIARRQRGGLTPLAKNQRSHAVTRSLPASAHIQIISGKASSSIRPWECISDLVDSHHRSRFVFR